MLMYMYNAIVYGLGLTFKFSQNSLTSASGLMSVQSGVC